MPRGRRKSSLPQPSVDDDEDELASSSSSKRATPLQSIERDTPSRLAETPYTNLRQLAGLIRKPATPVAHTLGNDDTRAARLSAPRQSSLKRPPRPLPAKKGAPTTPHAIRALQQRKNAALTPGQNRRRSGRQQRETPRDVLRNLSRVLAARAPAKSAKSTRSSLARSASRKEDDGSESDELNDDIPKPRLSLPIDEDDSFQVPPRLSLPLQDNENNTQTSIEAPRRAFPNADLARMSRASMRMSDRFADLSGLEDGDFAINVPRADMDLDEAPQPSFLESTMSGNDTSGHIRSSPLQAAGAHLQNDSFALEVPILQSSDSSESERDGEEQAGQEVSEEDLESADETDNAALDESLDVPADVTMGDGQAPDVSGQEISPAAGAGLDQDAPRLEAKERKTRELKVSRHGIPYPPLPSSMIKKIVKSTSSAAGGGKLKLKKETLAALSQASDWFFEQLGEDLGAYADHARRKTIDESDVVTLMKRQRLVTASTTPFSLAQKTLPGELVQAIRMMPPEAPKRRKHLASIQEEGSGDEG